MKRCSRKLVLDTLICDGYIEFRDYPLLSPGYRLCNKDGIYLGYITFDLWLTLLRAGVIVRYPTPAYTFREVYLRSPSFEGYLLGEDKLLEKYMPE